jgi:hypothetical protein
MILVSGPLIAQLCFRTRKWAHEAITDGRFGSPLERQGVLFVKFDRVEGSLGRHRFRIAASLAYIADCKTPHFYSHSVRALYSLPALFR